MIIFLIVILVCYAALIGLITLGWFKLDDFIIPDTMPGTRVSIIIAARNEETAIQNLLEDLISLDYPDGLMEVILVDDHSEDSTLRIANEFAVSHNFSCTILELRDPSISGKKAAIHYGVQHSTGELIITTDADCRLKSAWLKSIVGYYETHYPKMILGPVKFENGNGLFQQMQELEFISLIASTAGLAKAGYPVMANGANLAYQRSAYELCGGLQNNFQYASGDDVFMLSAIKKTFGGRSVHFLKFRDAIVTTSPEKDLNSFIHQRLRWVSKSRGYKDLHLLLVSILVYFTNLSLVLSIALACAGLLNLNAALFFYISKLLIDIPVMIAASRFFKRGKLMIFFPFLELLNALYTVVIGLMGNLKAFEWKARRHSPKN